MNRSAEQIALDEKIARIRKQNEEIIKRKQIIDEEIKSAERNNAIVNIKKSYSDEDNDAPSLYADSVSTTQQHKSVVYPKIETTRPRKTERQRGQEDAAWRREREQIDNERIRRQKAASGWRRAWDADKSFETVDELHSGRKRDTGSKAQGRQAASSRLEERKSEENEINESWNEARANINEADNITTNPWRTSGSLNKNKSVKVKEGDSLDIILNKVTKFSETKVQVPPKSASWKNDFSNREDKKSVADLSESLKNIVIRVKNDNSKEVTRTVELVNESPTSVGHTFAAKSDESNSVFTFSSPAAHRSTAFSFSDVGRSNVFSFGDAENSLGLANNNKVTSPTSKTTNISLPVGILKTSFRISDAEKSRNEIKLSKSVMIQDESKKDEIDARKSKMTGEELVQDDDDEWEDVDEEWEDV